MTTVLNGSAAWRRDGVDPALVADLHHRVGEALTAAHCSMRLLAISLITNMCTGVIDEPVDGSEVEGVAAKAADAFSSFLYSIVKTI